jgi:hypothetical protein
MLLMTNYVVHLDLLNWKMPGAAWVLSTMTKCRIPVCIKTQPADDLQSFAGLAFPEDKIDPILFHLFELESIHMSQVLLNLHIICQLRFL